MLDEIEAALQRHWDRETLVVYADLLQAQGDPRGTLIALALAGTPDVPRIRDRRRAAVEAWLGPFAAAGNDRLVGDSGFVNLAVGNRAAAAAFVESHVGGYLRRLRIDAATHEECTEILAALARRHHPWCAVIDIALPYAQFEGMPLPADAVERFFVAMPHASALSLRSVELPAIPDSIRRLELAAPGAVVSHVPTRVETVVAKFAVDNTADLAHLLGPARFPHLTRLDLAERSHDAIALFDAIAVPERLAWLRLPSIRDAAEAQALRAIRARLPALDLELAVLHRPRAHLLDASLGVQVPTIVPCAPYTTYANDDRFIVRLPDTALRFDLYVAGLAYNTETFFTAFSSEQQAALGLLWEYLDRLGPTPVGFPGAAFARVAETMMLTDFDSQVGIAPWGEVERALASHACSVQLSRAGQAT